MQDDDDPRLPATTDQPASDAPPPEGQEPEGDQQPEQVETDEDQVPTTDEGAEGDDDGQEQPAEDRRRKLSTPERTRRALERLRAENAELRSRVAPIGDVKAEVERRLGPPPKEADFNGDYSEYSFARTAYETDKRQLTRQLQDQSARDQASQGDRMRELVDTHRERIDDFRERAPDYDDVIKNATFTEVGRHVMELIFESEQGPALEYYLAKNPRTAERLSTMTPTRAAKEIGRIEASLSQPSQRSQIPRAPRPIAPLRGGASPPSQEASLNAYIRKKYGDR